MKLAMIGSYGHAGIVLGSVSILDDVELVACARWGEDDPLPYVGQHPAVPKDIPVYDDYRKMLHDVGPDVVGVFCPLYRNAEVSIAAAETGCHIVSEKPLATTHEDLARLRQAVEFSDVRIAALLEMRAWPAFQATRKAVREGLIGEPILAHAQKSYPFAGRDDYYKTRQTYGGSIAWCAIHALDFVSYCSGKDYRRVAALQANSAHPTHPGMEDSGGILLEFDGGGQAIVSFDYLRPWPGGGTQKWGDDRLRIAGSEGIVQVVDEGARALLHTPTQLVELPLGERRDFLGEFIDSITGKGQSIITPAESFRMTEVALKARDAADTGQFIDL